MSNKAARRAEVFIKISGVDVSGDINSDFLSLTYTDNEQDKTDDLRIDISDTGFKWIQNRLKNTALLHIVPNYVIITKTKALPSVKTTTGDAITVGGLAEPHREGVKHMDMFMIKLLLFAILLELHRINNAIKK